MSKLLINEYPLIVLPSLAAKIGLNEAIVLQQVHYWLGQKNVGVQVDGFKWIHNTYAEWTENFPFWSVDTVKRTIHSLESSGLLISAQTSSNPFDKTKSYRVNYEQVASLDGGNLHPSFTETTLSDTNNTASGENQPSAECNHIPTKFDYVCARCLQTVKAKTPAIENLPLEWQIKAGVQQVTMPDVKQASYMDTAQLIAMGFGINEDRAFDLAYQFMNTRQITIPQSKIKGQRKAIKEMLEMNVYGHHVREATQQLMDAEMTVTDLYSVSKTAIALANPPEVKYNGAIDGV